MTKIDAFCHFLPKPYFARVEAADAPAAAHIRRRIACFGLAG